MASSGLNVFAHNVETVERLQRIVRDPRAGYQQTLDVLKAGKDEMGKTGQKPVTKSSIMVGLGEHEDEVLPMLKTDARVHDHRLNL